MAVFSVSPDVIAKKVSELVEPQKKELEDLKTTVNKIALLLSKMYENDKRHEHIFEGLDMDFSSDVGLPDYKHTSKE